MRFLAGRGYVGIEGPFEVLSSAPWNGGLRWAPRIVNVQVPRNFQHSVDAFFRKFERRRGLPRSVGFLTAVDVRTAARRRGRRFLLLVTAGVGNPSAVGTINVLLALRGRPAPAAMVELVKVITEAKVAALRDLDVRAGAFPATGTSTDGVAVAAAQGGRTFRYAGPITPTGREVGRAVHSAVLEALFRYHGWNAHRSIRRRLSERGLSPHELRRVNDGRLKDRRSWEAAFGLDDASRAGRLPPPSARSRPDHPYVRALLDAPTGPVRRRRRARRPGRPRSP